jgi:hypothetical protein
MDYTTYISAAKQVSSLGQKELSLKFIKHAELLEEMKIIDMKFDILVGEVKSFRDAKFQSVRVIREKEGNTIVFIFHSGDNTHRVNVTISKDGSISWLDGNKFSNRHSVNSFIKLFKHLKNYKKDIIKLLEELSLNDSDLNFLNRTFYI